ncbi:DedA family protein [Micromonospora sp. KC606]|uniref:DedA family protein n=1 Tax=Micromonospora sp. KC606 TaxID=2530379 RepID=UPI00104BE738|nr:DedA family protein [Micromonospora sp. KC606]TDC84559.1 DedA family protein [Micromonospora sp. KC606]
MDLGTWLVERGSQLPPPAVYAAGALLIAAEVGVLLGAFVPAASVMLALGALSATGTLDLPVTTAVAVLAALLGDSVGYWEGRIAGPRLRTGRLGRRIGSRRWRRAEHLVRRGGIAVTIGRCTAFVRTLVPRVAGVAGMRYRRFLVYDAVAVTVWAPGTILIGYAAGTVG